MNSAPVQAQAIAPMSLDGLYQLDRVADPQLSPDGKRVVYQVTRILDAAKNQKTTQLWLSNTDGSGVRQLSHSQKADSHARWSPDGSKILFESNRDGSQQLYVLDVVLGGEAKKLTAISTGASNAVWAPDGKSVAFLSTVRPVFREQRSR
jgi:Tol biopolymer transport system component